MTEPNEIHTFQPDHEPLLLLDPMLDNHNSHIEGHRVRVNNSIVHTSKIILFCLGLLSDTGYVIVLSAAEDLAIRFGQEKLMSLFSGCMVFCSIGVLWFNAKFLLKLFHKLRITIAVAFFLLGVSSILYAIKSESFPLSLLGSMFLGMGGSLGEATIQGFLKGFPPETIVGYSAGSGGAGVFGSFYYLFLKLYGFDESKIFMLLYPIYVLYFISFFYLVSLKVRLNQNDTFQINNLQNVEHGECHINERLTFSIFPIILKQVFFYSINFGSVYFLKYSTTGFLAETAGKRLPANSIAFKYFYLIVQCIYQCGDFFSRLSLHCFKVPRLQILTLVQIALLVLWINWATVLQINLYSMFASVLLVGLMGGMSYVNTVYMILNDSNIPKNQKELCLNVNSMFADAGIILSSFFGYLFKTFMH